MPHLVSQPARSPATAGFTLLELLVVLTILGVLTAVIPSAVAGLPYMRLRAATAALAETLRQAHDDAVRTGRTIDVVISPERREYATSGQVLTTFPSTVDRIDATHDAPDTRGGDVHYKFFGDGSATGGTITLSHEQRQRTITIAWLTGRVRTNE